MLEKMRKGSHHPVVKGLFFLLALLFVVWGVGDVFRNSTGMGYVATVGKSGITPQELDSRVRAEIARYQEATGRVLSEEEANRLGVKKFVISQLVSNKVIAMSASDMGLVAGKKIIAAHISENEAFFDESGKFDKERYKSILKANGLTEEKYVNSISKEVEVRALLESLTISSVVPELAAKEVYRFKNETRVVDLLTLPSSSINKIPEPSDADLLKYYQDNQDEFSAPETRSISYIKFDIDKIKNTIKLSEDELKTEYQRSISQYRTEETRNVQQFLFAAEAEAVAAYEKISKGDTKAFAASQIELGNITKSSAPAEVKEAIFSLQKEEVSKPVKSSLGWHIFVVKSIEPQTIKTFEAVKNDIEKEMTAKKAADEFANFGNQVEDEFAAGKTMEEVAKKFDLETYTIAAVDAKGNGVGGEKISDLLDPNVILPVAFGLETGGHSALTMLSDNATYVVIKVDNITPTRIKTMDEVKVSVMKTWQLREKTRLLKEKATSLAAKIKAGEDIKSLISAMKLKINEEKTITRPETNTIAEGKNGEPAMLAREIFLLKESGDVTGAYRNASGDFMLARLKNIVMADPESDKNGYRNVQSELEDEMRSEIISQYTGYLQKKYPVSIKADLGGAN
jgi:peptidyl-prolyl cis-trans isomerase D